MAAERMSRDELLEFVRQLPEKTPIANRLTHGHSSKQSWINWLSNYPELGDNPSGRISERKEMPVTSTTFGGMHLYSFGLPKRAASIKSEYKEPPKLLPLHQETLRLKRLQFGEYCHGVWSPSTFV
jgi:hypothetical protein